MTSTAVGVQPTDGADPLIELSVPATLLLLLVGVVLLRRRVGATGLPDPGRSPTGGGQSTDELSDAQMAALQRAMDRDQRFDQVLSNEVRRASETKGAKEDGKK